MSERKETDKMSGHDTGDDMEWSNSETSNKGPETGENQNATGNPAQNNPSAGDMTQAQASHMSQDTSLNSGRRMDVCSVQPSATHGPFPVQGQQPNAMGNYVNPPQNNFPNPHPSAGQFPQVYGGVYPPGNMPVQGQHQYQYDTGNSSYPAQNNSPNRHPSAGQFPQGYQDTSMNTEVQGQHQYAVGNSSYPAQNIFPNPHPSAGQFPQMYQHPSVNMPVQGQHQYATGNSFYLAQNNSPNPHPSAGQFPQQGQHQYAVGNSSYPAQNIFPNPHPFAGQFPQVYQYPSVNMPIQGQHQYATGNSFYPAQNNSPNPHPSAGQFPQVPQDTSKNTEVDQTGQHQDASVKSFDAAQNNSTHPDTSAGQVAQGSAQPPTSENKDEVQVTLSVKWFEDVQQQKRKTTLQKVLQTWAHKSNFNGDCTVSSVSEDGRAEIKIKPAEAVSELEELTGQTLKNKGKKIVTITTVVLRGVEIQIPDNAPMNLPTSVSEPQHVTGQLGEQSHMNTSTSNVPMPSDNASVNLPSSPLSEQQHANGQLGEQSNMTTSSNVLKPTDNASVNLPSSSVSEQQHANGQLWEQNNMTTSTNVLKPTDNASVNLPSSSVSEPQHDKEPPLEISSSSSSAAASTTEEKTCSCLLPVVHFWYVNHIFKEDIKRIEREHGVKMSAEVNVTFVGGQKDDGLKEALSEFIDLVQKRIGEFDGSVTPLKSLDTEEFKDALKIIQRPENKLLVALSSEEITIYGPKPIPNAISKSLNAAHKSTANTYNSAAESQDTSLNIGMSIKDHLVNNGLTMQESHWKLMTTSFSDDVDKIKDKFGVDFKDSGVRQGKVNVKAHYRRSGGNASMESHAVRALLYLCQKIATSPKNVTQHQGATGFSDSTKNSSSVYPSQGASSRPVANSQSGYSTRKPEDSAREGATAGDNEDEDLCAICQDTFENKKQLKCKHEFCEKCLENLKKHTGPICPVCKDVFGVIEGTQPEGKMSVHNGSFSLPGFKGCDTIVIDYYIPSGKQTERHPNPGQHYHGTSRTAYLPDNKEGKEVLRLLEKAFAQKLIFTVGTSTTSGMENQVTWNDIHHKTSTTGGPQRFGYPDPDYLRRVRDELKAKGIE